MYKCSLTNSARIEGKSEGHKEGFKEWLREGRKEGREGGFKGGMQKGLEEGCKAERKTIILDTKKMGTSDSQIQDDLKISDEALKQALESMDNL